MGSCGIQGKFVAYDWKHGIQIVQNEAEEEYGYNDGYSGAANCVNFHYAGDLSCQTKSFITKYINNRMNNILDKREGEVILVGTQGYDIISTNYKEYPYCPTYFLPYLKNHKRPAVLLRRTENNDSVIVVGEGTIAEMKKLAHNQLRSCNYVNTLFDIIKKDKYICCSANIKRQKNTTKKTDDKYLVLERKEFIYYGWAPE